MTAKNNDESLFGYVAGKIMPKEPKRDPWGERRRPSPPPPPPPKSGQDETINDKDGNVAARIRTMVINPKTFQSTVQVVIPTERWMEIEVVCPGKAIEVLTESMPNGRYKVKKTVRGYKPATFEMEDEVELPTFETTKEFMIWIETLGTDEVMAFRQIYYDLWNFDSGDSKHRMYFELLEEELQGRK